MKIIVEGINHRTAPIELREKLAIKPDSTPMILNELKAHCNELAILSTCNRVETCSVQDGSIKLFTKLPGARDIQDRIYRYEEEKAVCHLFRVTSGLDAMVTGETQIISQIKSAYRVSKESGCTGKILNKLFETALHTAKKVHSSTRITDKNTSVSAVCTNLAYKIYGDMKKKTLVVIGAGEMAATTIKLFKEKNIGRIIIANRSAENALNLAKQYGALVSPLSNLKDVVHDADIILSCSSSDNFIIEKSDIAKRDNPLFLIDIGVPRNINPTVNSIENVYLYNIDELEEMAKENKKRFESDFKKAEDIVAVESKTFFEKIKKLLE